MSPRSFLMSAYLRRWTDSTLIPIFLATSAEERSSRHSTSNNCCSRAVSWVTATFNSHRISSEINPASCAGAENKASREISSRLIAFFCLLSSAGPHSYSRSAAQLP